MRATPVRFLTVVTLILSMCALAADRPVPSYVSGLNAGTPDLAFSGTNADGFVVIQKSPPTKDIYVDNILGSDKHDGLSPKPTGSNHGPVGTMAKAVSLLKTSDRLNIANTGKPYRDSIHLFQQGGTPEKPAIIEGNGAIMEGLETVRPSEWTVEPDGLLSIPWGNYLSFAVWVDGRIPARRVDVNTRPSIKPCWVIRNIS